MRHVRLQGLERLVERGGGRGRDDELPVVAVNLTCRRLVAAIQTRDRHDRRLAAGIAERVGGLGELLGQDVAVDAAAGGSAAGGGCMRT